eukprot:COSAG02_NODE_37350_length_443_cov_0.630814_2_plen_44_part_01
MLELCRAWLNGTSKLRAWDGKAALELYRQGELYARKVRDTGATV